ncbi:TIGR04282 family arsenosugar biosynthesis glycosyltransferase [Megalodesulfovibrio paquesii]
MNHQENTLLLFVRLPLPGHVKTRLATGLAAHMAANEAAALACALYTAFVEDLVEAMAAVPAHLQLWVDPLTLAEGEALQQARAWLGADRDIRLQPPGSLGERMAHAFETAFAEGAARAVLLGSDVPDYPAKVIGGAFEVLHRVDAIVGPALDGGYYAIGFTRQAYTPVVFTGKAWGENSVGKATLADLAAAARETLLLPEWNDVDELKDLNVLYRTNKQSSFNKSRTYALLKPHSALLKTLNMDLPAPEEVIGPDHVLARLQTLADRE